MKIPDIVLDKKWTRILGAYLLCLVSFQIYVYLCIEDIGNIFLYDPRIGLYGALEMLFHGKMKMSEMMFIEWMSAAWLGSIAVLMCFERPVIRIYIISESMLFILNITVIAIVAYVNYNSSHGFPTPLIRAAFVMMVPTTIIPFTLIAIGATVMKKKV